MISLQVALGIVLAVIIVWMLPAIVAVALLLAFVSVIALVVALVWLNLQVVAIYVSAIASVAVLYGVPFWMKTHILRKYPAFLALTKGEPPFNVMAKQPARIAVMACFAVAVALSGVGVLLGMVSLVDAVSNLFGK